MSGWASRKGAEWGEREQRRAFDEPSRGRFARLLTLEAVLAGATTAILVAIGAWWSVPLLVGFGVVGWLTTRFLVAAPSKVRVTLTVVIMLGMLALAFVPHPPVGLALVAVFSYATGFFLTFVITPSRAVRWRQATRRKR